MIKQKCLLLQSTHELRMLHIVTNKIKVLEAFPWWVHVYVLIFIWSSKIKFLMYLFSLREIHLDQNSIFCKILVLYKALFKMSCVPWLCWDSDKIICCVNYICEDRLSPFLLHTDPIHLPGDRDEPIILSTGCRSQALCRARHWGTKWRPSQWPASTLIVRKHLQKEMILKKENVHDQFYRLWLVKHVFLSKAVEEKRNGHVGWISSNPTNPWIVSSGRKNNSESQHLTLNHPDFFLLI